MEITPKQLVGFALLMILYIALIVPDLVKKRQISPLWLRLRVFAMLGGVIGWFSPMLFTGGEINLFSLFGAFVGLKLGTVYGGATYKGHD